MEAQSGDALEAVLGRVGSLPEAGETGTAFEEDQGAEVVIEGGDDDHFVEAEAGAEAEAEAEEEVDASVEVEAEIEPEAEGEVEVEVQAQAEREEEAVEEDEVAEEEAVPVAVEAEGAEVGVGAEDEAEEVTEKLQEAHEAPDAAGTPDARRDAPAPLDPGELLRRVVSMNKCKWWPASRVINAQALKALLRVSAAYASCVLDRLECLGPEEPNPSLHIHQAVEVWSPERDAALSREGRGRKRPPASRGGGPAKRGAASVVGGERAAERQEAATPTAGAGARNPKGAGKARGKLPAPVTRAMVGDRLQELLGHGIALSGAAVAALFRVSEQVAMAVLNETGDRASVQDPSAFVLKSVASEERRRSGTAGAERPTLPNPELFKMRFAQAVKQEEEWAARKGKGRGKGKGKGKDKDKGKGKGI